MPIKLPLSPEQWRKMEIKLATEQFPLSICRLHFHYENEILTVTVEYKPWYWSEAQVEKALRAWLGAPVAESTSVSP